jgi:hypothetical protein
MPRVQCTQQLEEAIHQSSSGCLSGCKNMLGNQRIEGSASLETVRERHPAQQQQAVSFAAIAVIQVWLPRRHSRDRFHGWPYVMVSHAASFL